MAYDVPDQNLSTMIPGQSRFTMLWGPPGGGKTVLAHQWPRTRTLDLDQGMDSVAWAIREGIIKGKKLEEIVYATITEAKRKGRRIKSASALDMCTDKLDEWLKEKDEWDTIVVDSATALNDYVINAALEANAALGLSKSREQGREVGMRVMRRQDWGSGMGMFTDFIDWLKSSDFADKLIVITAHEYETTDDEGTLLSVDPLLIGQLRQRVGKDFGEIYYVRVKGTKAKRKHMIQTAADSLRNCKSRIGCLPFEMSASYYEIQALTTKYWGDKKKDGAKQTQEE